MTASLTLDPQVQVGKSICALALLCETSDICPHQAFAFLDQAVGGGKLPLTHLEMPLLRIQRSYNDSIEQLRKFQRADRERIHDLILSKTEFHRCSAFVRIFDRDIAKIESEIAERQEKAKDLQYKITHSIGDKVDNKSKRVQLLNENSHAGTLLNKVRDLREQMSAKAQIALNNSNMSRSQITKKSPELNIEALRGFEELIEAREKLKARFFLVNEWPELLLDCRVQNAFDAVLREALPREPSCWELICCCFKI